MARRFVQGKMSNSLALLRRYSHRVDSGLIAKTAGLVEHAFRELDNAKSHASIMGLEGHRLRSTSSRSFVRLWLTPLSWNSRAMGCWAQTPSP